VLPARIGENCVVVGRLFSMVGGLEVKNVGGGMCLWMSMIAFFSFLCQQGVLETKGMILDGAGDLRAWNCVCSFFFFWGGVPIEHVLLLSS